MCAEIAFHHVMLLIWWKLLKVFFYVLDKGTVRQTRFLWDVQFKSLILLFEKWKGHKKLLIKKYSRLYFQGYFVFFPAHHMTISKRVFFKIKFNSFILTSTLFKFNKQSKGLSHNHHQKSKMYPWILSNETRAHNNNNYIVLVKTTQRLVSIHAHIQLNFNYNNYYFPNKYFPKLDSVLFHAVCQIALLWNTILWAIKISCCLKLSYFYNKVS